MADSIPVEHVEQIALWKQWVFEKQRGLPSALRAWERHLLCWDAREPMEREQCVYLHRSAEKAGLVAKTAPRATRGQYRGEL